MRFFQRRRERRLYRQWMQHAELPQEAMPAPGPPSEAMPPPDLPHKVVSVFEIPTDVKSWVDEGDGWFYRFRVGILNVVKKILRLE